jgi:hypothetical protein
LWRIVEEKWPCKSGDLLTEAQFKWNPQRQDKKKVIFQYRWPHVKVWLNRGDCMWKIDCNFLQQLINLVIWQSEETFLFMIVWILALGWKSPDILPMAEGLYQSVLIGYN